MTGKAHLKRITVPKTWRLPKKKGGVFVTRPFPGGHKQSLSMPLSVVMDHEIKVARTAREARSITSNKEIVVDGKPRRDLKYCVGLFSVISIPKLGEAHRLILNKKGKLETMQVPKGEEGLKLAQVIKKTTLKKGVTQLNLDDGTNIKLDKDSYATGDTLLITIEKKEVKDHFKHEAGMAAYLIGGGHIGELAKIKAVEGDVVTLTADKEEFQSPKHYVYVVGKDKPVITLEQ